MGRAKEISLKVIPGKVANPFMRRHHYSGTVVNNSCLHFGVFLDGRLHGVMSYGPSLNKSKILPLVAGTGWNEYLELNRMAFDSVLPRNSESRAISLSIKLLKKYAPHVKWIISFTPAKIDRDGNYNVKVGFSEPRPDGRSNAMIANVLEYGKSGQPAKPFMKPARSAARAPCIEAMKAAFEREVEKL